MKRFLAIILAAVLLSTCAIALVGCADATPPAAPAPEAPAAPAPEAPEPEAPAPEAPTSDDSGVTVIGLALDTLDDPYWVGMMDGIERAIEELGDKVSVDIQISQGDAAVQSRQIEDMITAGVDAILCVYVDQEAIVSSVRLANEKGIPFVFSDRPVDSSPGAEVAWGSFTDDYALSKNAWEWMVDYTKQQGYEELRVLELVGSLTDANVLKRTRGFEDVMSVNSDFVVRVQSVPTEWNLELALAGATNALQANPDINVVFMHSDFLLAPTIQALEAAGRWLPIGEEGHVIVMPYSGNSLSLKSVADGYVPMVLGMATLNIGYESFMAAYNIANGDTSYGEPKEDPGFLITYDNFNETAPMAYGWAGFQAGE